MREYTFVCAQARMLLLATAVRWATFLIRKTFFQCYMAVEWSNLCCWLKPKSLDLWPRANSQTCGCCFLAAAKRAALFKLSRPNNSFAQLSLSLSATSPNMWPAQRHIALERVEEGPACFRGFYFCRAFFLEHPLFLQSQARYACVWSKLKALKMVFMVQG